MKAAYLWLAAAVLIVSGAQPLLSQTTRPSQEEARRKLEQRMGRQVSDEEILERIRRSGLSRAQVRSRLQSLGYDPSLADAYFDAMERKGQMPGDSVRGDFLSALETMGVAARGVQPDTGKVARLGAMGADTLGRDSIPEEPLSADGLPVFGLELFRRSTSQFQPVTAGPVDPDYRLGPGDQVVLILTGDVESAYTLDVTREGYVVIPDVGQVLVNGLTLRQLEDHLHARLGAVYSGVGRSPGSSTHFQVSLGRLRTSQVFIIGEVERPGAYQVSSVATVFNALYQARGPNPNGSFRRIEVRRGGRVVRVIDLYDYLLHGDSRDDIRLEQGDVIFVPLVGAQVGVRGEVRRPARYEVLENDDLRDVLAFAGRLAAGASAQRVQIDRILPPGERRPGVDRVLVDVDLQSLMRDRDSTPLRDGDLVQVFGVSMERRNRLTVTGEVRRPGVYEWAPGTTIWDVIRRAEGLHERAYTPRAHIYRLNPTDGTRSLVRTPLLADGQGRPVQDALLVDRDSIVIYSRAELRNPETVYVDGFVKNPGMYTLAEGMTLRDLVLAAGGFTPGANTVLADVARRPDPGSRTDTTAYVLQVALGDTDGHAENGTPGGAAAAGAHGNGAPAAGDVPAWVPGGDEFTLLHGDQVFIRKAVGHAPPRVVQVTGEVMTPGSYVLRTRQERLLDVLERTGGLTREANLEGLRIIRGGNLVATDLERAVKNPSSRFNLVLEPGDSLHVPEYDPTVLVTGAVAFESRILYVPGTSLDYYIGRAGGYLDTADRGRVSISYQDGERSTVRTRLFFRDAPQPRAGSTIVVPAKPEGKAEGVNWDQFLGRTLSVISTTATLLVALSQLN